MHSRIYQVSTEPISTDELSHEYIYEVYFVGRIADYVAEVEYKSESYKQDLKWLQGATNGIEVDIEKGTMKVISKKEYFRSKHEEFQEFLQELNNVTLNEFIEPCGKTSMNLYNLQCAYKDKYGFYIDINGETEPLDSFVREAEENKVYYIGTITDYHF